MAVISICVNMEPAEKYYARCNTSFAENEPITAAIGTPSTSNKNTSYGVIVCYYKILNFSPHENEILPNHHYLLLSD